MTIEKVKVFQFAPAWGIPACSPFSLKLLAYMRFLEIPYETEIVLQPDQSPTKHFPLIEYKGKHVSDTDRIIQWISDEFKVELADGKRNNEQIALDTALRRLVEEHCYFLNLHARWCNEEGLHKMADAAWGGRTSDEQIKIWTDEARLDAPQTTNRQGVGRQTEESFARKCREDVFAVDTLLGDKPFLHGDEPCVVDCSIFGIFANVIYAPIESPLKKAAVESERLSSFVTDIGKQLFSDWPVWQPAK